MRVLTGAQRGLRHTHGAQQFNHLRLALRPIQLGMQEQRLGNFLADRAQGVERPQCVLHHKAYLRATHLTPAAFIELAQIAPGKRQSPGLNDGVRTGQPRQGARGHAFARAGLAHQRQAFSRL